ncbi:MAG: porin family protein [Pseudomonadota bacterium]|nr:porin family protein [Pseudomonadota bacterium]
MKGLAALGGLLLAAPLAALAGPMSYVDAYYIPDTTLEFEGNNAGVESDDGDGFGVKLGGMLGESLFIAGEYQSSDYEFGNVSTTAETTRIGLGYHFGLPLYVLGEYVRNELSSELGNFGASGDEDGYAAHLGVKFNIIDMLTLDARGGYLDVGDADGFEYVVGLGLNLDRNFGLFADYRVSELKGENDIKGTIEDVRAGLRFRF